MDVKELLLELMKIESYTGSELEISLFLKSYLENMGFEVETQNVAENRNNLIAKIGNPKFYFLAHMDTVEGEVKVREDEEKIYGRGSCDTKGCIASMICAGEEALKQGVEDIGFIFTVGEEENMIGAKVLKESNKDIPYVIVGEPTGLTPINSQYGIFVFKIITRGISAHTSNPDKGENAIQKMMKLNEKIGLAVDFAPGD